MGIFIGSSLGRVFAYGSGDLCNYQSSHIINSKMVLVTSLFNTQHWKVRIKDKVEQYKERSSSLPYTSVL